MKRISCFDTLTPLLNPEFKLVTDGCGMEFVVWKSSEADIKRIIIEDKTEFESLENHIHLLEGIRKDEFESLSGFAQALCSHCLARLKEQFPHRAFVVYVSLRIGDSMILRFHQDWKDEVHYYEAEIKDQKERLIKCMG